MSRSPWRRCPARSCIWWKATSARWSAYAASRRCAPSRSSARLEPEARRCPNPRRRQACEVGMPEADAVLLARAQFAFTIGFHIVLPALTIGLASYLAVLEALWVATGRQVYRDVFQYWLRAFAIVFAMGVVSGLVMAYEFGTNWLRFADKAGAVVGPLMSYEVLTAFFLEAGFLGILLFGRERVGRTVYFAATLLVAIGTLISATWILAANSWMQTPQGYTLSPDGRFIPVDWWQIVFNPSFPYRLVHMVIACFLSVAFAVGAVGAFHLRRDAQNQAVRLMFSMAMWMALVGAPIQI